MLIKNITITNFQCYYDSQTIDFSKGLNLIIGKGGKGKSKLFNAFYWVLFGKIYISETGWKNTDGLPGNTSNAMLRHEFINKKALRDASIGQEVKAEVILELVDDKGIQYEIERSVTATRKENPKWDEASSWAVSNNSLTVSFYSATGTIVKTGDLAEDLISELFPEGIRGYIWFQGESLDNLINFRSKENLRNAVKHISYYPYFEKLSEIISTAKSKITSAESKHLREVNRQNEALKNLMYTIESCNRRISEEKTKKKKYEEQRDQVAIALAADEEKLKGMAGFTEMVQEYGKCETEIAKLTSLMTESDNYQRSMLPRLWVLRGIDSLIEQAKSIIVNHVAAEYTMPEKKYLDNPSKAKLEEILHDKVCFVCGSPVDESHQHAIDYINERIHLQEQFFQEMAEYRSNMEFSKHFNMLIGKIQDYPDVLLTQLSSIDKQYSDSEAEIEGHLSKRKRYSDKKRDLDERMEDAKRKYGIDPKAQATNASILSNGLKTSRQELEKLKRHIDICDKEISEQDTNLKEAERELDKLGQKGTVTKVEETEWKNISTFLEDVCSRVQENARLQLLHLIEERANEFYKKFTEHDNGYKGKIEIDDDYTIRFDPGLNTSHEDRKKMSIINALLSLNQQALETYYPFISDAPTSNFDYETTHKYLIAIKDIFDQTIIITKDVEIDSENYKELMMMNKVSRIYNLESQLYSDTTDPEAYEVSTKINRKK